MNDPLEYYPAYVSPLTDEQHATLGRISLLWGQIEHLVEQLLPFASKLSDDQLEALQVPSKQIASKVAFLKACAKRLDDTKLSAAIQEFCAAIDGTKQDRNKIFHGIWGLRADDKRQTVFAAARKDSEPHAPFPASKLPSLEKRLCKVSRMGFDLVFAHVYGQSYRPLPTRFFHHGGHAAPQWLQQWSQRIPVDHDDPGYTEKEGQLPRRSKPYPDKR